MVGLPSNGPREMFRQCHVGQLFYLFGMEPLDLAVFPAYALFLVSFSYWHFKNMVVHFFLYKFVFCFYKFWNAYNFFKVSTIFLKLWTLFRFTICTFNWVRKRHFSQSCYWDCHNFSFLFLKFKIDKKWSLTLSTTNHFCSFVKSLCCFK